MAAKTNDPEVIETAKTIGRITTNAERLIHTAKNSRNTQAGIEELVDAVDKVVRYARDLRDVGTGEALTDKLDLRGESVPPLVDKFVQSATRLAAETNKALGTTPIKPPGSTKEPDKLELHRPKTLPATLPSQTQMHLKGLVDALQPKAQEVNRAIFNVYGIAPDVIARD